MYVYCAERKYRKLAATKPSTTWSEKTKKKKNLDRTNGESLCLTGATDLIGAIGDGHTAINHDTTQWIWEGFKQGKRDRERQSTGNQVCTWMRVQTFEGWGSNLTHCQSWIFPGWNLRHLEQQAAASAGLGLGSLCFCGAGWEGETGGGSLSSVMEECGVG